MRVRERFVAGEAEREEGDEAVVSPHEPKLARRRARLGQNRRFDDRRVHGHLLPGGLLGQRLEMRADLLDLRNRAQDRLLYRLRDPVRTLEREVPG